MHAVYIHRWQPRAVLEGEPGDYFTVQTPSRYDIRLADCLAGDLIRKDLRWLLNVNRQAVVCVDVIRRFPSIESAIDATTAPYFTRSPQRATALEWATIGNQVIGAGPVSRRLRTLH